LVQWQVLKESALVWSCLLVFVEVAVCDHVAGLVTCHVGAITVFALQRHHLYRI